MIPGKLQRVNNSQDSDVDNSQSGLSDHTQLQNKKVDDERDLFIFRQFAFV